MTENIEFQIVHQMAVQIKKYGKEVFEVIILETQ
jgi:hypothetical protein